MARLIHKLENNEAVLLMYLAGELPQEDRREVEQMLAGDATLRAQLEVLREAHQAVMDRLDACERAYAAHRGALAATRREAAISRLGRAMRQRQMQLRAAPADAPAKHNLGRLFRAGAVAAAIAGAALLFWSRVPTPDRLDPAAPIADLAEPASELLAESLTSPLEQEAVLVAAGQHAWSLKAEADELALEVWFGAREPQ